MPTVLEIQKPHLTYCQKYDLHCACPKCEKPHIHCEKLEQPITHCEECDGPLNNAVIVNNIYWCGTREYRIVNNIYWCGTREYRKDVALGFINED